MIYIIKTKQPLPKCPLCNSDVELQRNSGKRFQVKCKNKRCYAHTGWMSKTSALVTWATLTTAYAKNHQKEENK